MDFGVRIEQDVNVLSKESLTKLSESFDPDVVVCHGICCGWTPSQDDESPGRRAPALKVINLVKELAETYESW